MGEETGPVLIAMKGLPCTGKSTCARRLSQNLHWPLIDKDDIQSSIFNKINHCHLSASDVQHLDEISFKAATQMARSLFEYRQKVIIDSPLSSSSAFHHLLELSESVGAHLIVVECIPKDKFAWRSWLEERLLGDDYSYKSADWDEIAEAVSQSQDFSLDGVSDGISRLVVDTTADFQDYDLFFAVQEILTKFSQGDKIRLDLDQWLQEKVVRAQESRLDEDENEREKPKPHRHTHHLSEYFQRSSTTEACAKCSMKISTDEASYNCSACDLWLHASCAETPKGLVIKPQEFPPYFPQNSAQYRFPELQNCQFCIDEDKDFSYECHGCVFQSHIKSALLPSIVFPEGHGPDHALFLWIPPTCDEVEFKCHACGDPGKHMYYSCGKCLFKCHVKCALAPRVMKNKHHGHPLQLTYTLEYDDSKEHTCDACESKRNPRYWMYCCKEEDCDFSCHLLCESFSP